MKLKALNCLNDKNLTEGFDLWSVRGNELYGKTTAPRGCIPGGPVHSSNNFVVKFYRTHKVIFFCFSAKCSKDVHIGTWTGSSSLTDNAVEELIDELEGNPTHHQPY